MTRLDRLLEDSAVRRPAHVAVVDPERGISVAYRELNKRFEPFVPDLTRWCLTAIATECRAHGVAPVWIYLPTTDSDSFEAGPFGLDEFRSWAQAAGFATWSLDGLYDGHDMNALWLAPWDRHPNAEGHRVIADRLYAVVRENEPDLALRAGESRPAASRASR